MKTRYVVYGRPPGEGWRPIFWVPYFDTMEEAQQWVNEVGDWEDLDITIKEETYE